MDQSAGPSPVGLHRPAPAPPAEQSPANTPGPVVDRPVGPPPAFALHLEEELFWEEKSQRQLMSKYPGKFHVKLD